MSVNRKLELPNQIILPGAVINDDDRFTNPMLQHMRAIGAILSTHYPIIETSVTPVTGDIITLDESNVTIIDPAGNLATLTLNLPDKPTRFGLVLTIFPTHNVTSVTFSANVRAISTSLIQYKAVRLLYSEILAAWMEV
jgi:hypothetical protein